MEYKDRIGSIESIRDKAEQNSLQNCFVMILNDSP